MALPYPLWLDVILAKASSASSLEEASEKAYLVKCLRPQPWMRPTKAGEFAKVNHNPVGFEKRAGGGRFKNAPSDSKASAEYAGTEEQHEGRKTSEQG